LAKKICHALDAGNNGNTSAAQAPAPVSGGLFGAPTEFIMANDALQ